MIIDELVDAPIFTYRTYQSNVKKAIFESYKRAEDCIKYLVYQYSSEDLDRRRFSIVSVEKFNNEEFAKNYKKVVNETFKDAVEDYDE